MIYKSQRKAGLPPGSLVYVGERGRQDRVKITLFEYSEKFCREKTCADIGEALASFAEKDTIKWLDISGVHKPDIVGALGEHLAIHPLTQEDILNTEQRPKAEEYPGYLYIVFRMIYSGRGDDKLKFEQLSILLGAGYLVTFQEAEGDVFDPVRERLRTGNGRVRKMGADYLAYLLMDSVIDNCFIILESFGEKIENIETVLLENPENTTLHRIHSLKWNLLFMRKSIWPLREAVNNLIRSESELVGQATLVYLRDLYDHTIRIVDIIETLRDLASGMLEIYLSSVSNRMNEVMKVLTIIATIFIPLTLVAGIYGMNFEFMPELHYRWAYPAVLILMLTGGLGMLGYFRRRKWL